MRLIAGLALGALLPTGAAAFGQETPDRTLRVVTFNIFHGGAASGLTGDTAWLDGRLDLAVR